jgi:formylmethanofuran dehydrogenase subunit C
VSDAVTLTLRTPFGGRLDLTGVSPDRVADLDARQIAALPLWFGREAASVGDFFDVRGGRAADLRVEGVRPGIDGLGRGMTGGRLLIVGDAGAHVAEGMAGGTVEVRGDVGDAAGVGMSGGVLRVSGRAGDRLGAALPGAAKGMTGGEILVEGPAGRETASRCRRGLVVVGGSVGPDAARVMIAGTLVVRGTTEAGAGRGNKRGSIVALGPIVVPDTYAYACTFDPPYLRLLFQYLRTRYGLAIDERIAPGGYRRYCGDRGYPGKGEILASPGEPPAQGSGRRVPPLG